MRADAPPAPTARRLLSDFVELRRADVCVRVGDYEGALRSLARVRPAWAPREILLARVLVVRGEHARARRVLRSLTRGDAPLRFKADALNLLGESHAHRSEYGEALRSHERALASSEAYRKGKLEALLGLARVEMLLGDYDAMLRYARRAEGLSVGDEEALHDVLGRVAISLERKGESAEAARVYERLVGFYSRTGNLAKLASTLNNRAASLDDLSAALEEYRRAFSIAERIGDVYLASLTLNNVGITLVGLGRLREAEEALSENLRRKRALGDADGEAFTFQYLSALYMRRGDAERALGFDYMAAAMRLRLGQRKVFANLHRRSLFDVAFTFGFLPLAERICDHVADDAEAHRAARARLSLLRGDLFDAVKRLKSDERSLLAGARPPGSFDDAVLLLRAGPKCSGFAKNVVAAARILSDGGAARLARRLGAAAPSLGL